MVKLLIFCLIIGGCLGSASPGWTQAARSDGELTLSEAIAVALKKHPAIIEYREKTRAAQAQIEVSRANYFPQLTYNTFYNYGTTYTADRDTDFTGNFADGMQGFPTLGREATNYFSHRFTVNQLLYDFGKTPGQVDESRANYQASRQDYANTRQQVVLDAKTAYFGYLAAKRAVKVSEETVRQYKELVRQAEGFYRVGIRARIDVTKAEANLYDAESNLIKAKNAFQLSRVTLMTAMGLKTWPYTDLEDVLEINPPPIRLDEAKNLAFQRRPELLKNRYLQQYSQAAVQVARSGYFPTLNASANYGWRGSEYPLRENWSVGVGLSFPLFEGFATKSGVRQAWADLRSVMANEQVIRQDITKEVEQSYLDLESAAENIRATAKALEAARENLRLARGRYRAGVGTIIEVTDAQVQFFQAELRHIQALYDHKVAEAKLEKAIGKPY